MRKPSKEKGFSLIELIIVIAILSILAMIGLPIYGKYAQEARVSQAQTNCVVIGHAVEGYIAKGMGFPSADQIRPYLNPTAQVALDSGGYSFAPNGTGVTVTGPEGTTYP